MSLSSQQRANNNSQTIKKLFNEIRNEPLCLQSKEQLLLEALDYIANHQTYRNNQMQQNQNQQISMRSQNALVSSQIDEQSQNNQNSLMDSFTLSDLQSIIRKIGYRLKQLEYYKKVDDLQVVIYEKCQINYIYEIALWLLIVLGSVLAAIFLAECWINFRNSEQLQNNLFILICCLFVSVMSFYLFTQQCDRHCINCNRCKIIRAKNRSRFSGTIEMK